MLKKLALLVAMVTGFTSAAIANEINANQPESVAKALQDLGYQARMDTDAQGDPVIHSSVSGDRFNIRFYLCKNGKDCEGLHFSAGWDMDNGFDMERINKWNLERLVGKAHLDSESDPILEMYVTTKGGLNEANFADVVDWWRVAMGEFMVYIQQEGA